MNYEQLDHYHHKLMERLKVELGENSSNKLLKIYVGVSALIDLKLIIERIENELEIEQKYKNELIRRVQAEEKPEDSYFIDMVHNFSLLSLDIKSFYTFTKIYLDNLAKLIRYTYGSKGDQLSDRMNGIVNKKSALSIDYAFFSQLNEKMTWFSEFRKQRVEIVHYLGSVHGTSTRDGEYGIEIRGSRTKTDSWGTDTVTSIKKIMDDTINRISDLIEFILENRL